jgi:hypothetical protein
MKIGPSLKAGAGQGTLSMILPIRGRWDSDNFTQLRAWVRTMAKCLRPVFAAPWTVLTLSLDNPKQEDATIASLNHRFCLLFQWLAPSSKTTFRDLRRTDRLVLHYGLAHQSPSASIFQLLWEACQFARQQFLRDGLLPRGAKTWISKSVNVDQQGWQLVFDFRADIAPHEGALWELWHDDGTLKTRRLFDDPKNFPNDGKYDESHTWTENFGPDTDEGTDSEWDSDFETDV